MHPFLKFILRNIAEKKLRSFLILISIAATTALVFASSALPQTMGSIYEENMRQLAGTSDILMLPKDDPSAPAFLEMSKADPVMDKAEYAIGMVRAIALYNPNDDEMAYLSLMGTTLEDLDRLNPLSFAESYGLETFEGDKAIISSATAEKLGLKLGEKLTLEFGPVKKDFTITGLCNPKGLFIDEQSSMWVVLPKATLAELMGAGESVNMLFIKAKIPADAVEMIKALEDANADCTVRLSLDRSDVNAAISSLTTPMTLVSFLVILMSAFIIHTSFKVISLERLPVLGTFRSAGATKKATSSILLLESLLYGVIGGVIGCGLGIGALYFITLFSKPDWARAEAIELIYTPVQLAISMGFAVIFSMLSAWLPVRAVSRIPLKDIILNTGNKISKGKKWALPIGIGLFALSLILPRIIPNDTMIVMAVDGTAMLLALVSVILMIPPLTALAGKPLGNLAGLLLGNEGMLAVRNIAGNKPLKTNITLLTIGISSLLLIFSINNSLMAGLREYYTNNAKFDVMMAYRQADDNFIGKVKEMDGVTGVTGTYELRRVAVGEKSQKLSLVYGVDPETYLDTSKIGFSEQDRRQFDKLNDGRNIMVSHIVREKLKVNVGDTLTLELSGGKFPYTVTGVFDSGINNGNIVFVSGENLKRDEELKYYTFLYVKTKGDADTLKQELKRQYLKNVLFLKTTAELQEDNEKAVSGIFTILGSYSQLAMLIGVIGIINNLLVSFLERRKQIAVYRSVGMSKRQFVKVVIIEAVTCGVLGGLFSLMATAAMVSIIPGIMRTMIGPMPIFMTADTTLTYLAAGVVIMLAASVFPALKSTKLSIVETIKYE